MKNYEHIKGLSTWELAEFLHKVSENSTQISVCNKECKTCKLSEAWCISQIGEWLNEETKEGD